MITVVTTVICHGLKFKNKEDFKDYLVFNFVPETDPLRKYNFKLMDKYGHCFFNLIFKEPNVGILYHRYHTNEEYDGSINLRVEQKKKLNDNNISYDYKLKNDIKIMSEIEYDKIHTSPLRPTTLKINVEKFLDDIKKYQKFFKMWGDKFQDYGRYGLPLINMNGKLDNKIEPSCWPLDRWNFVNLGYRDTPEDFTRFYNGTLDMNTMVNETDFYIPTDAFYMESLEPLKSIESYLLRSCILKFHTLGHFKPHIDTWKDRSSWLRLWGTTHPEAVKIRYKSNTGEKLVWNDIKKEYQSYIPIKNIEPGRLYLHDSSIWHDAMSFEDNTYQFFIATSLDLDRNLWM